MKRVFIGHRGVGKTSLLERHQVYFNDIAHFDLDNEIEKRVEMTIGEFFEKYGEEKFRELEISEYAKIVTKNFSYAIAVGAGFRVDNLKADNEVIYVSRLTDSDGRLFLNRPRLDLNLSPLVESKLRYQERQPYFLQNSHSIYFLPEGLQSVSAIEKIILEKSFQISDAIYTLSAHEIPTINALMKCYSQVELRTDLLSSEAIHQLTTSYPEFNWLVSFRNSSAVSLAPNIRIDWDISLGSVPSYLLRNSKVILSTHIDQIHKAIQAFVSNPPAHLKLSPLVENFIDLRLGYEWQQLDPKNRSFLPRSKKGRWSWFRLLSKYTQKLNFIRNYSLLEDQPTSFEWLTLPEKRPNEWAAVMGSPVYFSRTPMQHKKYFGVKKTFVCKIDIAEAEFKTFLPWLTSLGLTYAAVTSPLKEIAYELANERSDAAHKFKAVNTFFLRGNKVAGHNTDIDGFKYLVRELNKNEHVAVWGGGGTLKVIFSVLPEAFYFSSQTAHERSARSFDPNVFKILVWAAPRSERTVLPASEFAFTEVIDLNYVENSMGLEYAMLKNIKYTSGVEMFREQAKKQQEYWSSK